MLLLYYIILLLLIKMLDDFKIILKGAIGSLTFGAYHMYITTIMIYENNRNNQLRIDEYNRNNQLRIDGYNRINQLRFDELYIKIEKLEKLSN
jgi:hypothetical protein